MTRLMVSELFVVRRGRGRLVFVRPGTGLSLTLEGRAAQGMGRALGASASGRHPQGRAPVVLPASLRALGKALQTHGVLCPWRADEGATVLKSPVVRRGGAVVLLGPGSCPRCLDLRLASRPPLLRATLTASVRRALVAEVLSLQSQRAASAGEVLYATVGTTGRGRLLVHGDCEHCGGAAVSLDDSASALRQAWRRKARAAVKGGREAFTDPVLGPLEIHSWVAERDHFPLRQPFVWGSIHLARAREGTVRSVSTQGGIYASAHNEKVGRVIALSEGVERLAARGARAQVWGRPQAFPSAVPLEAFYPSITRRQKAAARGFCHAVNLVDDRPCLVPWEAVVTGLPASLYPQALHRERFYTGAASHVTFADAVEHATMELIKRDAFMLAWYRRCALPRLEWPRRTSRVVQARADYLVRQGFDLELFDLRLDFPMPTLLLRVTARRAVGNWPRGGALLVASGGFSGEEALGDALRLAGSQFVSIGLHPAAIKNPLNPRAVRRMGRIAEFWPLLARYLRPSNGPAHAFLGKSGTRPFESLAEVDAVGARERLRVLKGWFLDRGMAWLAVRLTDVNAEAAGLETVRVIVPGLLLPTPSRREIDFEQPRLWRDWPGATIQTMNRDPHPAF